MSNQSRSWSAIVIALFAAAGPGLPHAALLAQGGRPTPAAVASNTLDLASALRLAAERSPALEQADARIGMQIGDVRATGQWPNPVIEFRRENLGAPIEPDEFFTAFVPIDLTGRRFQLARATSRGVERLELERATTMRDVQHRIARKWVSAVLAEDHRRVARTHHDAVQEIADIERARALEGVVAEAAAFRTRVEANRLSLELATAESHAQTQLLELAALIGVPSDSLPPLPPILDSSAIEAVNLRDSVPLPDDAVLISDARRNRTELHAAERARDEAALRQKVESAGIAGDWQLQGGTKRTGGYMSGQLGLAVPLPLFNRNSGARTRSANAVREAEANWRATQFEVEADVRAAADQLRRLLQLGAQLRETSRLGDQIAASARVSYAEGHMTLLELLDAHRAAADARRTARQYRADLIVSRLTLARATGTPLLTGVTP